jgi:hypothetical protein
MCACCGLWGLLRRRNGSGRIAVPIFKPPRPCGARALIIEAGSEHPVFRGSISLACILFFGPADVAPWAAPDGAPPPRTNRPREGQFLHPLAPLAPSVRLLLWNVNPAEKNAVHPACKLQTLQPLRNWVMGPTKDTTAWLLALRLSVFTGSAPS